MNKVDFTKISFRIISHAGFAKSNALMAISAAKQNKIKDAQNLITEAEKSIIEAEKQHIELIEQEAQGVQYQLPVIFMHAEDQMLTSQMMIEIAKEFIDLYQILINNKLKIG